MPIAFYLLRLSHPCDKYFVVLRLLVLPWYLFRIWNFFLLSMLSAFALFAYPLEYHFLSNQRPYVKLCM